MTFGKKMIIPEYSDNCLQSFYAGRSSIGRLSVLPAFLTSHTQATFARLALWGDELAELHGGYR